ncbi:phosphotransferase [Granulicatella sp. zg-ZJ]|uniref:phosphotransferase family protein n=1 Tax=unclassified Granulicatella TaxID=2630493 RepID=UPI0013C048EE|nr:MULTISPECIES: phosphotransferase family protein [unclassified Granulicatella]MBS4750077.1 phosphotransferase family protein [Carnobacteriaceae bacterium zg-ZUI78]NEW63132.1 phosphotransferase [Granulicatella sp. zg-ZJ]NEW65767.1 phosphotransferase [Granulicatella sp. zg-84]QMI86276.1 phosphotransferase family protein [Carnobacteriaceae bacterium zg-84]
MDYRMDSEWDLYPLGGETGQSYMGVKGKQNIFLKRNTTPFLAAVSTEGMTPKLLWTKRTVHGEVLTAQEWIDARQLDEEEMVQMDVLNLVRDIHQSEPLLKMLKQIDGKVCSPMDCLSLYAEDLQTDLRTNHFLNDVYNYLQQRAVMLIDTPKTVCHGDLNHRNFLLEKTGRLYLVDWEMVKLCDPMLDIANILCQYVDRKDWLTWIDVYGLEINQDLIERLEWYVLYDCLISIKKNHFQGRYRQMNNSILLIKDVLKQIRNR